MEDITDVYLHFLDCPDYTGVFNAGFENIILEIANLITKYIPVEVIVTESMILVLIKLIRINCWPQASANSGACYTRNEGYRSGLLKDEDHFYNLKWMEMTKLLGINMNNIMQFDKFCVDYANKLSDLLSSSDWSGVNHW